MAPVLPSLPVRALHGVRWRARALRRRLTAPLVTVVVPVYHVEAYVEECLTSVLEQTHPRLQVVVVDDGGTDTSMDIVRRLAAGDRRVQVISQPNAGLGAARNTGIRAARGRYLRFVDSDDVLPPDSIAVLVDSLERSGSDFAVGNLRRMTSARTWVPAWAKEVHREDRIGIGLDDLPDVLKDVFAHNKLFRTDFFSRVVGAFPEGVLYEDQEPTARAYASGVFDVLRAVVYHWRVREDGTSITQQKSDSRDLRDRLLVKDRVGRIIGARTSPAITSHWHAKAIGFDLRPYYEQVPRTGAEFWTQLQTGVARFAEQVEPEVWAQVPMVDRLLALATVADLRDDVIALLTRRDEYGWLLPGTAADGVVRLDRDYLAGLTLDPTAALLAFADADITVRSLVESVRWTGSRLSVQGYAHLRNVDLARTELRTELALVSDLTGEVRPVPVSRREAPWADVESRDSWNSYAASGFAFEVDLGDWPTGSDETWRFRIRLDAGGVVREHGLTGLDRRRSVAQLPVGPQPDPAGRWVLQHDDRQGLAVKFDPAGPHPLLDVSVVDRSVEVTTAAPGPAALLVECRASGERLRVLPQPADDDRTRYRFTLPAVPEALSGTTLEWRIRAETPTGRVRLVWPGTTAALLDLGSAIDLVRATCSREGTLRLQQQAWAATVDEVGLEAAAAPSGAELVTLRGRLSPVADARWSAWLVGDDLRLTAAQPVQVEPDGTFRTSVALLTDGGVEIASGGFELELTRTPADGPAQTRRVGPSDALLEQFPLERQDARRGLTCTRSRDGALRVRPRRPHADDERGRLAQRRIHDSFATVEGPSTGSGNDATGSGSEQVVLECFGGKSVGDSVLALYLQLRERYPDWTYYFSVAELTTAVPAGSRPLLRYTWEWARTVRQARYLINNANFPHYFRKGPHQTYVQTWHGTPLKKVGNDVPAANLSLSYRALMQRERRMWDYLLAQSPFAADVLPRAFGYSGPVIDLGYPRNDPLVDGDTVRKSVRHELGVADDEYLVLYAPTWRDDVRTASGQYELVGFLDFDAAAERLGDVTFLLRGHSNTVSSQHSSATVRDVSGHPDINDLMLAADALVTDYSSVMFDFCVTGKPMYFLVPDLERYGSTTRGFYFDLPEVAPGPVCLTDAELVDALAARDTYAATYAERYRAFVDRFAPYDDGHVAERVTDLVWGPRPAAADVTGG